MNASSFLTSALFLLIAISALAIDPEPDSYIKASNTRFASYFGQVVAISGSTMVVGAPYEDGASTGVNGDQNNFNGSEVGAAYVFIRVGTEWVQQAYLKPARYNSEDHFGASVAISGDTIVVGAPGEDSNATGVNGDSSNNTLNESGAAYVFVRQGNSWIQQAYLKASNTGGGDDFGFSVGVDGNLIAVSAPDEDSSGREINGDQSTNNRGDSGAVYVFARSGTTWTQQAFFKAANADNGDAFGYSVAVSGATVAVGAPFEESWDTDPSNNNGYQNGAVYVFKRSVLSVWTQEAYLKAGQYSDTSDHFGFSVAISKDTVVVGAPGEDGKGTKVNGPEYDNTVSGAGAAYVFHREGTTWSRQAYLKVGSILFFYLDPTANQLDKFGSSVAICGERVVVGCPHYNLGIVNNSDIGSAFLYQRQDAGWDFVSELYMGRANYSGYYYDEFGSSVAVSDKFAVVGAPNEDSPSKGTHGDPSLGGENDSGAAYTFFVGPQVVGIAKSGMPAPGGPSIAFGKFGEVCVDGSAAGQVLFGSSLTGPGALAGQTQAMFDVEYLSGLVWMSMRTGTPVGGMLGLPSSARISALSKPVNIGAYRHAYYQAQVGTSKVVLMDDGNTVQSVFRTGMPMPALNNASISTIIEMLPASGQSELAVHYKLNSSTATDSGFIMLDHTGAVVNPGLREGSSFFGMGTAKFGQMVRVARGFGGPRCIVKMIPGNGQPAKDTVCSLTAAQPMMQGELAGDTTAGERYGTFTGIGTMGAFSLIKSTLTNSPSSTNEGLWLDNGVLVARKGQDIGGGVKISRFIRVWANDAPHYLLHVVLSGTGVTKANNVALLLKPHNSTNFQVLIRTGHPVPGISDPSLRVRNISAIDTASAGGHYMVLATTTGPSSTNQVLLAGRTVLGDNMNYAYERRPQLLLRKGDKIHTASTLGSTVTGISIRPVLHASGVGNYGERRQVNAGFAAAVVSTSAGTQELLRIAY
jgi:hypothetical protein